MIRHARALAALVILLVFLSETSQGQIFRQNCCSKHQVHQSNCTDCTQMPSSSDGTTTDPGTSQAPVQVPTTDDSVADLIQLGLTSEQSQASFAPNMIGDFSGNAGSSMSFRMFAGHPDFDPASTPGGGAPITLTGSATDPIIAGLGNGFTGQVLGQPIANQVGFTGQAPHSITTAISGNEVFALLASNPRALIPLIDSQIHRDSVIQAALALGLPMDGSLQFDASNSVMVTPDAPPFSPGDPIEWAYQLAYNYVLPIGIQNPGSGGSVGKVRLSDNNSALPQDRLFVDFNYFANVPTFYESNTRRMTPGIEKTFYTEAFGLGSFEVRVPMASSLATSLRLNGINDGSSQEFGNVNLALKHVLSAGEDYILAFGLGMSLPTGDDFSLAGTNGTQIIHIENRSVHLTPYLAALYQPNDIFFSHLFWQFDFDTNGNPAYINSDLSGPIEHAGRWHDPTFMYVDLGVGAWLTRSEGFIRGTALSTELHFTGNVQDPDFVAGGSFVVGDPNNNINVLNGTLGYTMLLGQSTTVTMGVSAPLLNDRVFDTEGRLFINQYY